MRRDLFAREALAQIPKILTLQDRNPHSPTYGCFDRNFWHYKILDFPSGMAQEMVWPLALVYALDIPGNLFRGLPAIREWVRAGVCFTARSAHRDGSCDDYFPYERATGAAAFSLLACLESCELIGLEDAESRTRIRQRADWLMRHRESGRLSNHEALIALALERAGRVLGTPRWESARRERLARVLEWQSSEGWFQEYEGCDPGYDTLTISALARLLELEPDPRLRAALVRAVGFAAELLHPDGTYGGELGSRNTYNFFPHGFELVGRWLPSALEINDRFLGGLERGLGPCHADDHLVGHHAWNYLLAWRDFVPERPPPARKRSGRIWFYQAGFLIDRRGETELFVALRKGGAFKLFRDARLVVSDTQVSLRVGRPPPAAGKGSAEPAVETATEKAAEAATEKAAEAATEEAARAATERAARATMGKPARSTFGDAWPAEADPDDGPLTASGSSRARNAVAHLIGDYGCEVTKDEIVVSGSFAWAKQTGMTPLRLVALRLLMLSGGRLAPDLVRRILQRALVTGRERAPFNFERRFRWSAVTGRWRVLDEIYGPAWDIVLEAGIGSSQTSIYNVMSRTYQVGQLQPWLDLTPRVRALAPGEPLRVEREP